MHLVSWEKVCRPKHYGGLGLRKARDVNLAFMVRAGWRLCTQQDTLWTSVIRKKYKCGDKRIPEVNISKPGSNFWRGICSAWSLVQDNTMWRIGNGNSISFWRENWIPNAGPLFNFVSGYISDFERSQAISYHVTNNNAWDVGKFQHLIPENLSNRIKAMVPPNPFNDEDSIAWKQTNDGMFHVASAYTVINRYGTHPHKRLFLAIWHWKGPERIRGLL